MCSFLSSDSDLITTAPPTTAVASTLPVTTVGATMAVPTAIAATPAVTDCEDDDKGCGGGGETKAPYDYDTTTGKSRFCAPEFVD